MKTQHLFLAALLSVLLPHTLCIGQNVIPHPVSEEFASTQYVVSANGEKVPVFHAGLNVYFASFDFTGAVDVKVTAGRVSGDKSTDKQYVGQVFSEYHKSIAPEEFWQRRAQVRPLSKNVKCQTNGAQVTFSLTEPGQYSVERPGTSNYRDQVLFVFANRPETGRPKVGDAHVIYLEPGLHHRNIDLESGQTLYLAAGAVLFGALNVWDAKNVTIAGRGVILYYGPQSLVKDTGYKHRKDWRPLTTHNADGINVDGITIINRSRTWTIQMHTTFNAVFNNIIILSINSHNIQGDGFDWLGGGKTKITNSLVRSADDCFACYTTRDILLANKSFEREVKNILIQNCVLWPSLANVFRLGFNGENLITDNVTVKNCDVIHIGKGEWVKTP